VNTEKSVVATLSTLKVGDGFELGKLMPNLPTNEKMYWELEEVSNSLDAEGLLDMQELGVGPQNIVIYRFSMYYLGAFLRYQSLTVQDGEVVPECPER